LFHSSLYYPAAIRLQFDGFLVGIEKSPRERIAAAGECRSGRSGAQLYFAPEQCAKCGRPRVRLLSALSSSNIFTRSN
jgi:hypothetical protein